MAKFIDNCTGMENYSFVSNSLPFLHLLVMEDDNFIQYFYEVDGQIRIVRESKESDHVPNIKHNVDVLLLQMEQQAKVNYEIVFSFMKKIEKELGTSCLMGLATFLLSYNLSPEIFNTLAFAVFGVSFAIVTLPFAVAKVWFWLSKDDILRYKYYIDHKEEFSHLPIPELQDHVVDMNVIAICNLSLEQLKGYLNKTEKVKKEKSVKRLIYNLTHQNEINS